MGDRALVQFIDSKGNYSPAVYLHWRGFKVGHYLEALQARMGDRLDDVDYSCARFIGIVHEDIEGELSLGVREIGRKLRASDSPGDAGCFIVNCKTWKVRAMGGYGLDNSWRKA